jgi:hypothetical protein
VRSTTCAAERQFVFVPGFRWRCTPLVSSGPGRPPPRIASSGRSVPTRRVSNASANSRRGRTRLSSSHRPSPTRCPKGGRTSKTRPENSLLVPSRGDLPGVNAGTSDSIGIYTSVSAGTRSCTPHPAAGVGNQPTAIAKWITQQHGFVTKKPRPVVVGGLKGLSIDVVLAKGSGLHCAGTRRRITRFSTGSAPQDSTTASSQG